MKWLGHKLKEAMSKHQYTEDRIASSLCVRETLVSEWIAGTPQKSNHLAKMCFVLNIETVFLFEEDISYTMPKLLLKPHAKKNKKCRRLC